MNSFGRLFRVSIYGESHGDSVGILIDGTPPGIPIDIADFEEDLKKRKAGGFGTTTRIESDQPQIRSGIFNGNSTGAPILIMFQNNNTRSADYYKTRAFPRPGHSDMTAASKFRGFQDYRGGGHFSGRLTLGMVAAGVIAKKILPGLSFDTKIIDRGAVPFNERLKKAEKDGDSTGAVIECRINGVEPGLGEPFFDSLESAISHMMFSIPAIKGIEFGGGFDMAERMGSEVNDGIINREGETESNFAGGINGGISNGNQILFRVAVKPTSSIKKEQFSVNLESGKREAFAIEGRHDVCIALRMPVIVEAAASIVLSDMMLLARSVKNEGEGPWR